MKTSNYAAYFAIENDLKKRGIPAEREDLIAQFTDERKTSLRELTRQEYQTFISWLSKTFNQPITPKERSKVEQKLNLQRRKIIALLTKIGYTTPEGKADMPRIYRWVLTHGYLHKGMNDYRWDEIPKLVVQAQKFYKSHIERL